MSTRDATKLARQINQKLEYGTVVSVEWSTLLLAALPYVEAATTLPADLAEQTARVRATAEASLSVLPTSHINRPWYEGLLAVCAAAERAAQAQPVGDASLVAETRKWVRTTSITVQALIEAEKLLCRWLATTPPPPEITDEEAFPGGVYDVPAVPPEPQPAAGAVEESMTMAALPESHPEMQAWNAYKERAPYKNTKKWAAFAAHVDGSLWAAFDEGWRAAIASHPAPPAGSAVATDSDGRDSSGGYGAGTNARAGRSADRDDGSLPTLPAASTEGDARARELLERCVGELRWCSGSPDFNEGGQARVGWQRGPAVVIEEVVTYLRSRANPPAAPAKET